MRLSKRLLSAALSAILLLSAMVPASATVVLPEYFTPDAVALSGDVNGDGKVDTTDARLVLQHAVGKSLLKEEEQMIADVNGDGRVDTTDARLILQYAVGKIEAFPTPFEGEVDFRVLQYTSTLDYIDPPFQLFIARSSEEFVDLREQAKILPKDWELEDEFFENYTAIVVFSGYSSMGPMITIDRLSVEDSVLQIDSTTGFPLIVGDADSVNMLLLAADKTHVPFLKSYVKMDTALEFWDVDSAGEMIAKNEEYRKWFQNWLEKNSKPQ